MYLLNKYNYITIPVLLVYMVIFQWYFLRSYFFKSIIFLFIYLFISCLFLSFIDCMTQVTMKLMSQHVERLHSNSSTYSCLFCVFKSRIRSVKQRLKGCTGNPAFLISGILPNIRFHLPDIWYKQFYWTRPSSRPPWHCQWHWRRPARLL